MTDLDKIKSFEGLVELFAQVTVTARVLTRAVENLANNPDENERKLIAEQMRKLGEALDEFMPDSKSASSE